MVRCILRWVAGLVAAVLMMGGLKPGPSTEWYGAGLLVAQGAAAGPPPTVLDSRAASRLVARQVPPEYPPVAKVNYIQGLVRLQVVVTREGRVGEAHVVEGHPTLAASALRVVRHWVYRPLVTNARAVPFETFVDIRFTLRPRKIEQVPQKPERDLDGQVRPPQVLTKPVDPPASAFVRLRVLVSEGGQALDSIPLKGDPAYFLTARKAIESWRFQPARWGAVRIPWYLEVEVPVETSAGHHTAADIGEK